VLLAVGGSGEINAWHKAILWLIALHKHGYNAKVYLVGRGLLIEIDEESIRNKLIHHAWDRAAFFAGLLSRVPERGIIKKYEALLTVAKEALRREAKLEAVELGGKWPRATLVLSIEGREFRYRLYYTGKELELQYRSANRAEAEAAAAALMLFGVRAEVRELEDRGYKFWRIAVYTDGLASGDETLRGAVLKFVEELWAKGAISEKYYERLRAKLEFGVLPDAALHVYYNKRDNMLEIRALPQSKEAYDAIMKRLLAAGLIEDKDLTADEVENEYVTTRPPKGEERGYIRLRVPEGLEQLIRNALFYGNPAAEELRKEIEKQIEALGEKARQYYEKIRERALSVGTKEFKGVIPVTLDDGTAAKVELLGIKAYIDKEDKLHILQRFKVDGVEVEREIMFKREGGRVRGFMDTWEDVEGGRETDLKRLLAYCKAVGLKPTLIPKEEPRQLRFSRSALDALMRFREVAEPIREWLSKPSTG
jgi:hypothetical protein